MQIKYSGFDHDKSAHYLVRAFFFGCTLSEEESNPDIEIVCKIEGESITIIAKNCLKSVVKTGVFLKDSDIKIIKGETKRTLYRALCELIADTLPWGILVGIRPTKLIREMEEEGKNERDIISVLKNDYLVSDEKIALAMKTYKNEKTLLNGLITDSASLYVAIPFCPSRCNYCSFVSQGIEKAHKLIPEYVKCIVEEIEQKGKSIKAPLQTIYIGGGTPTVLSEEHLEEILGSIAQNFDLSSLIEYTVECGRPDTITKEKLEILKKHGVTRISINPQTMNDKTLDIIGRKHTSEAIIRSIELARKMGFDNINMDLIAGLEGESVDDFTHSVNEVLKLNPENITLHSLCIKRGSDVQIHKKLTRNSKNSVERMLNIAYNIFTNNGYEPYYLYRQKNISGNLENVSYAKGATFSPYNVFIMQEVQTIIGVGAGAVSKIVENSKIKRIANVKYPYEYVKR